MADTINGFPIIKSTKLPDRSGCKSSRVILVDRGEDYVDRYVTAMHNLDERCWYWGHYIDGLTEASQDFDARVARGY